MDDVDSVEIVDSPQDVAEEPFALVVRSSAVLLDVVQEVPVVRHFHDHVHFGRIFVDLVSFQNVFVIQFPYDLQFAWQEFVHEILRRA